MWGSYGPTCLLGEKMKYSYKIEIHFSTESPEKGAYIVYTKNTFWSRVLSYLGFSKKFKKEYKITDSQALALIEGTPELSLDLNHNFIGIKI